MISVRKASISDVAVLQHFQKQLYGQDFDASNPPDLERIILDGRAWVATDDSAVIGYQACELNDLSQKYFPNSVFLSELFVAADSRKRGAGRLLVEAALNEDWPKEYVSISLTHDPAEPHLTEYYGRFGFKECGRTDVGNVMMIRPRQQ